MDKISDLAVIGGGIAGVSAAITAAQRGLKVKIFDRSRILGIKPRRLFLNAVDPLRQQNQKIQDSTELFFRQTISYGEYRGFPELVKTLCYTSPNTIQWLEELGVTIPARVIRIPEGIWPRTHLIETQNLTAALRKRLEFLKTEIREHAEITEIIPLDDHCWKVRDKEGNVERFRNVLLATGQSSIGELFSDAGTSAASPLSSLLKLKAAFAGLSFIQYEPEDRATRLFLNNPAEYILVDGSGKRFAREDASKRVVYSRISAARRPVVCIRFKRNSESDESLLSFGQNQSQTFKSGLEQTIKAFNASIDSGKDYLEEGRDPASLISKVSPSDAVCKAIRLNTSAHLGGVSVNSSMNIVTWNGEPLQGLYAAGGVLGGIHGQRAVKGNELLASLVFGRLAGSSVTVNL